MFLRLKKIFKFLIIKENTISTFFFKIIDTEQPDDAYLSYFKLTLFDPPLFIV